MKLLKIPIISIWHNPRGGSKLALTFQVLRRAKGMYDGRLDKPPGVSDNFRVCALRRIHLRGQGAAVVK